WCGRARLYPGRRRMPHPAGCGPARHPVSRGLEPRPSRRRAMCRRLFLWSVLFVLWSAAPGFGQAKKVLLVGQGPDGHPPGTHEYVAGQRVLARCLEGVKGLEVLSVRADGPWAEGPELLERVDGVVLYVAEGAKWLDSDARRRTAFGKLAARGGGLVALHWAIGTRDAGPIDGFLKLVGGCHGGPDRKYQVLEADVQIADPKHPITRGITPFR